MKRKPTKPVFTLGRLGVAPSADFGYRSKITNSYVPTGSSTVTVRNSAGFSVGQDVYISRAVTDGWLRYNGMDDLVRDGDEQTWIPIGQKIMSPNTIKAVNGNQITFRIPLADSLNSKYMAPEVWAYTAPDRTSEMGVQNLRIEVPNTCSGTSLLNTTCNYAAVRFSSWTVDSWAKGLTLVGFNKFFEVQKNAARITIQSNTMDRDRDIEGTILPFDIALKGSQVLVKDCEQVGLSTARSFSLSTDALTPGPNAVVRYSTPSNLQIIAPYQRWAWGLLVEDTSVATRFENRGNKGSGHGWTMNSGVGWNLRGKTVFESPPLGTNWCVGCGRPESETGSGNGTFILKGTEVTPTSLFGSQLSARGF
ncbi:hypothetical protein QQX98_008162 [Neonectria punicea]|uniref:Uncharacterized protein n=1 Tax=Neonectria punicea TaxID=979145 RepID=A0ABR1GVV6_9HYPO